MLYLHGVGHFHPTAEISNRFLEALDIGTDDAWILERTGIRSRRTVLDLDYIRTTRNQDVRAAAEACEMSNAELVARAARMALARAGIGADQIGLVIGGGSVPDYVTPAESCQAAALLDITAPCLDLRSACTSFGAALYTVSLMDADRAPEWILLTMAETATRSVSYNDRSSAVLWGDAAVAAVLSTRVASPVTVDHCTLASNPHGHDKVIVPWAGYFAQEGATVQSFAIRQTVRLLRGLQNECADPQRLHFIGHQANGLMLENVCARCDIPAERHHSNVADFGNTATAGSPSVLSADWDRFGAGDEIALVGVGAGLSWATALLKFHGGGEAST